MFVLMKKNTIKIRGVFGKYMKFGETLLEFSKGTFFHNVLDSFFFCTAFTRGVFNNVSMKKHIIPSVRPKSCFSAETEIETEFRPLLQFRPKPKLLNSVTFWTIDLCN
jgi:hypothetical protein